MHMMGSVTRRLVSMSVPAEGVSPPCSKLEFSSIRSAPPLRGDGVIQRTGTDFDEKLYFS